MSKAYAMYKRPALSKAGKLNVIGLITAAIGILILFLTGWISQSIPVGSVLLILSAGLTGINRWRSILIIVEMLTLFLFVGGFVAPGLFERLSNPASTGVFVGTWIQEIGLLIALVAGGYVILKNYQPFKNR